MAIERQSNQTMNAIFSILSGLENIVCWMCTADYSKQLYLSQSFDKIWGRPRQVLYEDLKRWGEFILPEDMKKISSVMSHRSKEAQLCSTVKFRIIKPDGQNAWIKNTSYTLNNHEGNPIAILGVDENLTPELWNEKSTSQPHLSMISDFAKVIEKELKLELVTDSQAPQKIVIPNNIQINNKSVHLTNREAECLQYLMEGKSAKETAYLMNISKRTVDTYLDNLRMKTSCRTKIILLGKLQNIYSISEGMHSR